jgi:hypothetical protein
MYDKFVGRSARANNYWTQNKLNHNPELLKNELINSWNDYNKLLINYNKNSVRPFPERLLNFKIESEEVSQTLKAGIGLYIANSMKTYYFSKPFDIFNNIFGPIISYNS